MISKNVSKISVDGSVKVVKWGKARKEMPKTTMKGICTVTNILGEILRYEETDRKGRVIRVYNKEGEVIASF